MTVTKHFIYQLVLQRAIHSLPYISPICLDTTRHFSQNKVIIENHLVILYVRELVKGSNSFQTIHFNRYM